MTMSITPNNEWEGPIITRLQVYDSTHGDTVQYRGELDKSRFQFYAPKPLLVSMFGSEPQETVIVEIAKTTLPMSETGFRSKNIPPRPGPVFWEYEYCTRRAQPVNSWLYEMTYNGKRYGVYIPHEVMHEKIPPTRLMVYLGVPEE